jgi:hypothetical protein
MSYTPHSSHRRRRRTHLQQQAHHLPRSLRPPSPHPWRLRPQHPPARSASPNREITAQAIRACIKQKFSLAARPTAPTPACAVATRAEVSLSGPASCSCSSRARSSGAALPPLELRRAWHARGRWPPAEVGRAGARWQGMQAGGGAGRQAGRRLGAEERRAHLPLPTAAALPRGGWLWHGSRRRHSAESALNACQLLSTEIPSLACGARRRAMLAGWRCSPPTARDARAYCALFARRAEACLTPLPTGARELWKRDTHGDEKQN